MKRDAYGRIYMGNFGDVNPLDYHGFFVWWIPPAGVRVDRDQMVQIGGSLEGIKVLNWCDATGECKNEELVIAEDLHVDIADLYSEHWMNLGKVAMSVGVSHTELDKDPIWAWEAVIDYYGSQEFASAYKWEFQTFKEAKAFLRKRGVPAKDL